MYFRLLFMEIDFFVLTPTESHVIISSHLFCTYVFFLFSLKKQTKFMHAISVNIAPIPWPGASQYILPKVQQIEILEIIWIECSYPAEHWPKLTSSLLQWWWPGSSNNPFQPATWLLTGMDCCQLPQPFCSSPCNPWCFAHWMLNEFIQCRTQTYIP